VSIRGFVEFANPEVVRGWAFDPEDPSARLNVVARIGADVEVTGCASAPRSDLLAAGIGDGAHGFVIDLPSRGVSDIASETVEVYALSDGRSCRLPRISSASELGPEIVSESFYPVSDLSQYPVFILGAARSGTSAMTLGLLSTGGYEGSGEGHLLPIADALLGAVQRYYDGHRALAFDTSLRRVPSDTFYRFIRRGVVHLTQSLFPTGKWLDKTPTVEMVRAAPLFLELFPKARFIFMKRRVIENVLSRRRKFPLENTEAHYSDWVAVMKDWLTVREILGASALEIEHRTLALYPSLVSAQVGEFLGLSSEERSKLDSGLRLHPEQTDTFFGATYSLGSLALPDTDEAKLRAVCDQLMFSFGYTYDASYSTQ